MQNPAPALDNISKQILTSLLMLVTRLCLYPESPNVCGIICYSCICVKKFLGEM